jgi:hypothetical protein
MSAVYDACETRSASAITIEASACCDKTLLLSGCLIRIGIKPSPWPQSASTRLRQAAQAVIAGAQVARAVLHPQDSFRRNGIFDRVGQGANIIGQSGFRCKTGIPAGVRDRITGIPQPLPAEGRRQPWESLSPLRGLGIESALRPIPAPVWLKALLCFLPSCLLRPAFGVSAFLLDHAPSSYTGDSARLGPRWSRTPACPIPFRRSTGPTDGVGHGFHEQTICRGLQPDFINARSPAPLAFCIFPNEPNVQRHFTDGRGPRLSAAWRGSPCTRNQLSWRRTNRATLYHP